MALLSMTVRSQREVSFDLLTDLLTLAKVILFTIVTQGARIPEDLRGSLKGSLFFRNGFVQAVGVIAFAFVCRTN